MALTPYRPSTDLFRSVFDEVLGPMQGWGGRMADMMRMPESDVVESENDIRVVVELPGMKPEDIDLDLENNVLTISGHKQEEQRNNNDTWHLSERRYGKFSRSFVLPRDVDQEGIQARFDNGVLSVMIPKSEKARRRRIEIQGGGARQEVGGGGPQGR